MVFKLGWKQLEVTCHATKKVKNWACKKTKKPTPQDDSGAVVPPAATTTKLLQIAIKRPTGATFQAGLSSEPPAKRSWAHPATTTDSVKNQMLAVSRDLLQLFIELDKMDGSFLKTTVAAIRNQLETARD